MLFSKVNVAPYFEMVFCSISMFHLVICTCLKRLGLVNYQNGGEGREREGEF